MEQGSSSWLDWRKKGIGSSDAPIVMGVSPYKSRYDLYLEKTGGKEPAKGNDFIFEAGHALEKKMRAAIEIEYDVDFPPKLFAKDFMLASLDGFNDETKTGLECKLVGRKVFDEVKKTGMIPDHHFCQVQHQMMVGDFEKVIYVYCLRDKMNIAEIGHVEIFKDADFVAELEKFEKIFWDHVQNKDMKNPAEGIEALLDAYELLSDEHEKIKEKLNEVSSEIKKKFSGEKVKYGRVTVYKSKRKGAIDYAKATKGLNIDFEKFRKKEITTVTIKVSKGENDEKSS